MAQFKALQKGFYKGRQRPGAIFTAPDTFSAPWAEKLEPPKAQSRSNKGKDESLA